MCYPAPKLLQRQQVAHKDDQRGRKLGSAAHRSSSRAHRAACASRDTPPMRPSSTCCRSLQTHHPLCPDAMAASHRVEPLLTCSLRRCARGCSCCIGTSADRFLMTSKVLRIGKKPPQRSIPLLHLLPQRARGLSEPRVCGHSQALGMRRRLPPRGRQLLCSRLTVFGGLG